MLGKKTKKQVVESKELSVNLSANTDLQKSTAEIGEPARRYKEDGQN